MGIKGIEWTATQIMELKEQYNTIGRKVLAERWGISESSISHQVSRMKASGVKFQGENNFRKRAAFSRVLTLSPVNIDYFQDFTAENSYIRGYLWADGNIFKEKDKGKLSLRCKTLDEDVIWQVRDRLRSNNPVRRFLPKPLLNKDKAYQSKSISTCQIGNIFLINSLIKNGLLADKSNLNLPLPEIPPEYINDFIRGYMDGDGSITEEAGFKLFGSHQFIESLIPQIKFITGTDPAEVSKDKTITRLRWKNRKNTERFYHALYDKATIYLLRKRRLFELQVGRDLTNPAMLLHKDQARLWAFYKGQEIEVIHEGRTTSIVFLEGKYQRLNNKELSFSQFEYQRSWK